MKSYGYSHFLSCLFQHVFDKNSIPLRRVADKHVRHRSDQLPVLNDRTAAHPLNDTARALDQPAVGHRDRKALRGIVAAVDVGNFYGIFADPVVAERAVYHRVPVVDLIPRADSDGFPFFQRGGQGRVHTEYAVLRVGGQRAALAGGE